MLTPTFVTVPLLFAKVVREPLQKRLFAEDFWSHMYQKDPVP